MHMANVSSNRQKDCIGPERFSGCRTADSSAVLQTSVLSDSDIRACRDTRELFANRLGELGNIFSIELLSTRGFSLSAPGSFFGVRVGLRQRSLDGFRLSEDALALVTIATARPFDDNCP